MKNDKIKALQKAKEYAASKNGLCLSNEYITSHSKMEWKCNNSKHSTWFANYSSVVNTGGWCPKCRFDNLKQIFKSKNGLEKAKEYAISNGGDCLSKEYINSYTKLEWKCKNSNHMNWLASYTNVVHGKTWCPECSKENYNNTNTRLANSLIKAKNHALSKLGQCLTLERINAKEKLEWKCQNENHISWFSSYNNVVNLDCWCPQCAKESMIKKNTVENGLEKARQHAISKKGKCLSSECINSDSKLEWKCSNVNHNSWIAKCGNVIRGSWCPQCAVDDRTKNNKISNGLEMAKEYAKSKNGKCLSTEYINSNTKMEWQCENSMHKSWFTKYSHIKAGTWCPECAKEKFIKINILINGFEKAKKHAQFKGGDCLSSECLNSQSKLEWKCKNRNHPSWFAKYTNVVNNGNWCRQCRIELDFPKEKYLKLAKNHAKSKNGKCLSTEYINNRKKMEWKCENKTHKTWFAVYTSIVNNNSWCPDCALDYNKQELKVQQILNYLFKTNFEKTRDLKWNINPKTNFILELDGYSKKLNIAFEFQGRHHFEDNIFKGTKLCDVQYRDKIKKENCERNGVELIIINELRNKKNCLNFFNQILEGIKNTKLSLPNYDYKEIEKLYNLN